MQIFFNNNSKDRVIFMLQSEGDFEPRDLGRIPDGTLLRVVNLSGEKENVHRLEFVQEVTTKP
jgi:hypothetical protein